jgi:hypothetical protein
MMNMISYMMNGRSEMIADALRAQFGAILAARIVQAEEADFLWEARVRERYLGQHFDVGFGDGEETEELSRMAILSSFDGEWHVAACLVDGEGLPSDLLWKQAFDSRAEAEISFLQAR